MDSQKVDMFLLSNNKNFEAHHIVQLRDRLGDMDESKWPVLATMQFKDPTLSLIISLLVGHFGVDRFYIGDIGLGIIKLLTCGGLGIWYIVDWFLIMGTARQKNFQKIQETLYY